MKKPLENEVAFMYTGVGLNSGSIPIPGKTGVALRIDSHFNHQKEGNYEDKGTLYCIACCRLSRR